MENKLDFFISHSHVDKEWAAWIADLLNQKGYSTFWGDRDLTVGDNFVAIIQEYIEKADYLIAILSPSYYISTFCQAEVSAMLAKDSKGIIPVNISNTLPTTGNLKNLLYIDMFNIEEDEAKRRLLEGIEKKKRPYFQQQIFFTENNLPEIIYPGSVQIKNVDFSNEEFLVERTEKIKAIKDAFNKNNTVASTLSLSGLAGVGKTVVAKQFIMQYGYLYKYIWWIDAQNKESIIKNYNDFCVINHLLRKEKRIDPKKIVIIVKEWMQENENWLFVFDNVNDFDVIQNFLPEKHLGNILITSRSSLWGNSGINEISIDVLSPEASVKFLRNHRVTGDDNDLLTLSQILKYNPSYLKIAAKYISEHNLNIAEFLSQNHLSEFSANSASTYSNIAKTFREYGDYNSALEYYQKSFHLLDSDQYDDQISIINSIASIYQELNRYQEAHHSYKMALDIVEEIKSKRQNISRSNIGLLYNNFASILRNEQCYLDAIEFYNKALEIFKSESNDEPSAMATILNNLAITYVDLKKYEKAIEYYYKALSIREKYLGINHPDTAKICIGIAEIYNIQSDYKNSISLFEKALAIYINVVGDNHPYIATIYSKIASIYTALGDYQKASQLYNTALGINREPLTLGNEIISNSVNIIEDDKTISITSLGNKPLSFDASKDVIDKKTKIILDILEKKNEKDFEFFKNHFSKLQQIVSLIKKELIFEPKSEEICHYSKLDTLNYIIKPKDSPSQPKLRISNIAYLNDPSEGTVLPQLLKKSISSKIFLSLFGNEIPGDNKLSDVPYRKVFIGSFSTAKNKLPMWTLYGDDSKGCCLVFDEKFFDKMNELIEEKTDEREGSILSQDLTLYQVKYIDVDNLDQSDIIANCVNDLASILNLFENIILKYEEVKEWVLTLLDEIRFLFKDGDYAYENEVRIIIHAEGSEIKVSTEPNEYHVPKLYLELQQKLMYKEIILGSKIERPNSVAPFLLHSGMVKKVTKSGIHYQ